MRRLLKARELGLPEGDVSTLELRDERRRRAGSRRPTRSTPRPSTGSTCCARCC